MSSKAKLGRQACKKAHTNREWLLISRGHQGDCLYCPPNAGENLRGHHSKWGRKRAIKHWYATGRGRNKRLDSINRFFNTYPNNCYYDKGIVENLYSRKN